MQRDSADTSFLFQITNHLAAGDTLDEVLASTVEFAVGLVNCEECCTYVRQASELVPWVWKYVEHGSPTPAAVQIHDGFAGALSLRCCPVAVSHDSAGGITFKIPEEWSANPGESLVCVPFLSRSHVLGAITLQHWRPRPYTRSELNLLSSVGYLIGAELQLLQLGKEHSELLLELETHKLVARSKGILQRELGVSDTEAHLVLQRQSQQKKRTVKEIAQAIILSAEVRQSVIQAQP